MRRITRRVFLLLSLLHLLGLVSYSQEAMERAGRRPETITKRAEPSGQPPVVNLQELGKKFRENYPPDGPGGLSGQRRVVNLQELGKKFGEDYPPDGPLGPCDSYLDPHVRALCEGKPDPYSLRPLKPPEPLSSSAPSLDLGLEPAEQTQQKPPDKRSWFSLSTDYIWLPAIIVAILVLRAWWRSA